MHCECSGTKKHFILPGLKLCFINKCKGKVPSSDIVIRACGHADVKYSSTPVSGLVVAAWCKGRHPFMSTSLISFSFNPTINCVK